MVLVMREAYTVVQIQKKQERDLLKQKEIDKNAALFKSAREKLKVIKRSDETAAVMLTVPIRRSKCRYRSRAS